MMSDVPFGVLLSGGLDSSLVASIASRIMKEVRLGFFGLWFTVYGLGGDSGRSMRRGQKQEVRCGVFLGGRNRGVFE